MHVFETLLLLTSASYGVCYAIVLTRHDLNNPVNNRAIIAGTKFYDGLLALEGQNIVRAIVRVVRMLKRCASRILAMRVSFPSVTLAVEISENFQAMKMRATFCPSSPMVVRISINVVASSIPLCVNCIVVTLGGVLAICVVV